MKDKEVKKEVPSEVDETTSEKKLEIAGKEVEFEYIEEDYTDKNSGSEPTESQADEELVDIDLTAIGDATQLDLDTFNPWGITFDGSAVDIKALGEFVKKEGNTFLRDKPYLGTAIENIEGEKARTDDLIDPLVTRGDKIEPGRMQDGLATSSIKDTEKDMGGDEAVMNILMNHQGLRKITLINSGFNVIFKAPSLRKINQFYADTYQHLEDLGYILGGHAHTCLVEELRELLIRIIHGAAWKSNLKGFKDFTTFTKACSFNDLDHLIWAVLTQMHPKGTTWTFVCSQPNCLEQTKINLDITKLRIINYDMIENWMYEECHKNEVTLAQALQYQKRLLDESSIISEYNKGIKYADGIEVTFRVPSVHEVSKMSKKLISDIMASTGNRKNYKNQFESSFIQNLVPWIASITSTKHGNRLTTTDPDAIAQVADSIDVEGFNFGDKYNQFMSDSKITHIAYETNECPSCGNKPKGYNGFITMDVVLLFFGACYQGILEARSKKNDN